MAVQDRCGGRHVDQLDPFVDVQHVPRRRTAAERVAVGQSAGAATGCARRVDGQHLVERSLGGGTSSAPAVRVECVADDDEAVAMEQFRGSFDLGRDRAISRPLMPLSRFNLSRNATTLGSS